MGAIVRSPLDYRPFYLADPVYFEPPERLDDSADRLAAARRHAPAGWARDESGWWITLRPATLDLPEQGWLIHVSVTAGLVARAVELAWGYCVDRDIAFDFVRSARAAAELNAEHADRKTSGKLITIYPVDEAQFAAALSELAVLFDGMPGPHVLGARRHGPGPLYVRYTAFGTLRCPDATGDLVPALRHPDGHLVVRGNALVFGVPDWITLPETLRSDVDTPKADDFPYRVERALNITNGGGTYVATHRDTGERVVLREARPYAGLDRRGDDAVTRLARERDALKRAAGIDGIPRLRDELTYGGHHFLAVEFVDGETLDRASIPRFPLMFDPEAAQLIPEFTGWACDILAQVERILADLQDHGLRLAELNARNVLLQPDGRVAIVDLESATDLADQRAAALGEPDATVPAGLSALAAHRYLVGCLRLFLFLPVPYRNPAKLLTLADAITQTYPVPRDFGAELVRDLWPAGHPVEPDSAGALLAAEHPNWPVIRDSMVRGIHASATPDRRDRLFPGTPLEPTVIGGYALGYGAAGVLYALHRTGIPVPAEYVDWLVRAVERDPTPHPGLYDGLHGVALTLAELGHRDAALEVLARARECPTEAADQFAGRAGIGLNLLHFARLTGADEYLAEALRLGDELAKLVPDGELAATPGKPAPYGLLHGMTGLALFFLHLHADTGEPRFLDLAASAARHDLDRCRTFPDGTTHLFDGRRYLVYLHGGSSGLGLVLREYLRYRPDSAFAAALPGIRLGCQPIYVRNSGLFRGRAGMIGTLAAFGEPDDTAAIHRQIRRLAWYVQCHDGELVFPGFRMLRLAGDLATGTAGVLLALSTVFDHTTPLLPHLHVPTDEGR
jgi:hypothetical protein